MCPLGYRDEDGTLLKYGIECNESYKNNVTLHIWNEHTPFEGVSGNVRTKDDLNSVTWEIHGDIEISSPDASTRIAGAVCFSVKTTA